MSRAELIKKFSDYVYYFNAYCTSDAEDHEMLKAVLSLLNEQDDCENCAIAIEDRQPVVRCQDCKHRPTQTKPPKTYGFSIEFPEGSKCPCQCDDGFYSWYPTDNWYCADGERKTDDG